jgi:DNA-directed RNA polymerase subunit N (RpoN/RPB10)
MVCSCGVLLGNKEFEYEKQLDEFCNKTGIDKNSKDERLTAKKQEIVNSLCRSKRLCCKTALLNYVDVVQIIGRNNVKL